MRPHVSRDRAAHLARSVAGVLALVGGLVGLVALAPEWSAVSSPRGYVLLGALGGGLVWSVSRWVSGHRETCQTCGWATTRCDCEAYPEVYGDGGGE